MAVNMTTQSIAVGDNWQKVGTDYIGSSPNGAVSGGDAALGWSANDGVADGNTITITTDGTYSFGTKTNAKPMYFWDAKDGLNSSSLSRRAFTLSVGSMNGSSDLTGSSDSYRVDIPTAGAITSGGPFYTDLDGAGDHIALFSKRKTNFTGLDAYAEATGWNCKLWRWWSNVGDGNVVIGLGQSNTDHGNFRVAVERTGATTYAGDLGINQSNAGIASGWRTELLRIKQGTLNNHDGLFQFMGDGDLGETAITSKTTSWPDDYREFYWPQAEHLPHSSDWAFFFDCFYLDDTPQMVVVSDESTWTTGGTANLEIAIPTAWSSSSVTAQLRVGSFSSLSGKFLYVLDNTGEPVSASGVELT
jgi:hypothetical protein